MGKPNDTNLGRRKSLRAFTLLESVVAIFMVMMGVCTFGSLAVLSKKLAVQTQFRSAAVAYARQQLDVLATASYPKLKVGDRVQLPVPTALVASLPVAEKKGYQFAAEYLVEAGPSPTLRQVTIHVWWRSKLSNKGADKAAVSEMRLSQLVAMQPPDPALK